MARGLAAASWQRGQAADDPAQARRWFERARRILPEDDMIGLSLALACLRGNDPGTAAALFDGIATRLDLVEAWTGLAASAVRLRDAAAAVRAMQAALSGHAAAQAAFELAATVAGLAGLPGWCGVDAAGRLHADAPAGLLMDGLPVPGRWRDGSCRLPPGSLLSVRRGGVDLLGSPIDLRAIASVEGFVAAGHGGLAGWAWHRRNPARPPAIAVTFADGSSTSILARPVLDAQPGDRPMARRRGFHIAADAIPPGPIVLTGSDGRRLLGSPVDPGLEQRSAAGLEARFMPVWADIIGPGPAIRRGVARRGVDVVVPVHGNRAMTLACLDSVLPTLPRGSRLHVVDDASADPALAAALDRLAAARRIVLHRLAHNLGFPGAANTGIRAAAGRDVVLLNSDTLVAPGWLEALSAAAHSQPWIGSACPLSNDASILSYPHRAGNPMPDPAAAARLAQRANGAETVEIPVGVGFCMFMRRDCLDAVGLLRDDVFAQGYAEENDWCLRARNRGWRHVAATGAFVVHAGGASFGPARDNLRDRNEVLLHRLHPGYPALVGEWLGRDPLAPARRRMDALRWQEGRLGSAVVLVTQSGPGGVARVVAQRAAALQQAGIRPILLRPDGRATVVGDGGTPNLAFRLPEEWPALLRLLRADRVAAVELHHLLGHQACLTELAPRLGVPQDVFVHDYAAFCARIALVARSSYCGEPDIAGCEACVADHGTQLEEDIGPSALVLRSAALLAASRRVVAPSADTATRLRRHFPRIRPEVEAWEDDAAIPPPPPPLHRVRHVCVVGAIGVEKGYEILLACVRDAAARALDLRFTIVGHTDDDERLFAAGPVFITGRYREADAEALIRQQDAGIAFIPSIWPETWCFALGLAWRAGLQAAVFDLGAPAERVRRTGWGHVLPLGLPPAGVNDWLMAAGARRKSREPLQTVSPSTAMSAI